VYCNDKLQYPDEELSLFYRNEIVTDTFNFSGAGQKAFIQ
jgi:hypothetical protein